MKNEKISIRPMRKEEARLVASLLKKIVKNLTYYNVNARRNEVQKYSPVALGKKVKEDPFSVLVAFLNRQLMGFCLSRWDDYTIWIEWFGVDPAARGKGVAKKLLETLEKTVKKRKAHKIWCDCRTTNEKSFALLTSFGYQQIAIVKNHWYGQDFILWHKTII